MKCIFLQGLLAFFCFTGFAQQIVFDPGHFAIVNENAAVRLSAELSSSAYLDHIHSRLEELNLNLSAVFLIEDMIHRSLIQVDAGLQSGLLLSQIYSIGKEISLETIQMLEMARSAPHLLLFAESLSWQMSNRAVRLATEVSEFVLKEGGDVLMDYEKRDALLKKIALELKVIRALVYSMSKSMYWARLRGTFRSLNPFQAFFNQDLSKANDILNSSKLIKK